MRMSRRTSSPFILHLIFLKISLRFFIAIRDHYLLKVKFIYQKKALKQSALCNGRIFGKLGMNDLRLVGNIVFKNLQVGNLKLRHIRYKSKLEFIQQGIAPGNGCCQTVQQHIYRCHLATGQIYIRTVKCKVAVERSRS